MYGWDHTNGMMNNSAKCKIVMNCHYIVLLNSSPHMHNAFPKPVKWHIKLNIKVYKCKKKKSPQDKHKSQAHK